MFLLIHVDEQLFKSPRSLIPQIFTFYFPCLSLYLERSLTFQELERAQQEFPQENLNRKLTALISQYRA